MAAVIAVGVTAVAVAAARRAPNRHRGTVAVDMAAVEPAVRRVPNRLRDRAVAAGTAIAAVAVEVAAAVRAAEAVRAAKAAEAADTVGATGNPA